MLVIFIVLFVLGFLFFMFDWTHEHLYMVFGTVISIYFFFYLILIPFNHINVNGEIQEFNSVKQTLKVARQNNNIERAALAMKIVESNEWLASIQYYNKTQLDVFIPDEVENLEPIE